MQAGQLPIETIEVNVNRAKNALNDKMICECTEDEVKSKLKLIYSMVGLRPNNYPQEQEKTDLHHYIFLKYSKKTLSELVLAFDLAINNELDLSRDEVKVYDQFTISYLATIMSAYKKWLFEQSKKVKKDLTVDPKSELPQPKMSNDEILQLSKEIYDSTKNLMFIESRCYEILELAKTITDNERVNIKKRAIALLEHINEGDKGYKPTDREVIKTCKKIAVAKYFDG